MSEYDGRVVYRVEADTSGVDSAISQTEQSFKQSGDGIMDMFKKITGAVGGMKVVQVLKNFATSAVGLASDLAEVQNVVDVTFGDGAASIEAWSKNAGLQFGLTEIQAKNFTSTLGAMMKSAGLAGPEIVTMSTDLAGLAADMASFYNMDFETAFSKIRSGLAGVTMPLQQLGINMSETNLQAFALTKGITKSFDKMTQGEKTLLRYQYLMSVTADAQGDFARTSDGLANASRQLETNLNTITANIGKLLEPAVRTATGLLAELTTALVFGDDSKKTVLDKVAEIDLDTQTKVTQIETTAEKARDLVGILRDIENITSPQKPLSEMAEGADKLTSGKVKDWAGLKDAVADISDTTGKNGAVGSIQQEANRLKAVEQWKQLSESVTDITSTELEDQNVINKIDEAAALLTDQDVKPWSDYAKALEEINRVNGETKPTDGSQPTAEETKEMERLMAVADRLGITFGDAASAHDVWLETCKQLVGVLPGLNSIINTETGEIEGGTEAVNDYIDAWVKAEKAKVYWDAHRRKGEAINKEYQDVVEEEIRLERLRRERNKYSRQYEDLGGEEKYNELFRQYTNGTQGLSYTQAVEDVHNTPIGKAFMAMTDLNRQIDESEERLGARSSARKKAMEDWEEEGEIIEELYGSYNNLTDAQNANATATEEMTDKIKAAEDALKSVADYIENTRQDTIRALDSVASGFEEIETPAQKATREVNNLEKALADAKDQAQKDEIGVSLKNAKESANDAVKSVQQMNKGLESQIQYYEQYNQLLEDAKKKGVSDEVLAALSDGSQASFDYLDALSRASDGEIKDLNKNYAKLGQTKQTLADTLTQQKLLVDQTFQGLVKTAEDAVAQLDQSAAAGSATEKTVQGIIDGINAKYPDLVSSVDKILAQIARLSGFSFSFGLGNSGFVSSSGGSYHPAGSGGRIPEHETGLDYVPFTGYLASLHEGEGILTAEENRAWQAFKNGGASASNSIDYGRLSGAIWDNAPSMGGNVYLDGQTVGRVISAQQADSLRSLTRSGWQG